jgi:PAS domain S-box-containing protein
MVDDTRSPRNGSRSRIIATAETLRRLGIIIGLAAAYALAAKLGLSMAVTAEQVSAVWPPTGVALVAILLLGYRVWPGIWLGAFFANATAHEPIATAFGIAIGNTLEAVSGAWLLRRIAGFDNSLERIKDVLGLILLAAGVSTAIAATVGVTSLCLGGVHPWSIFGALWTIWWLGDAMGNLVVAPVLLTATIRRPSWSLLGFVESAALAAGLVGVGLFVFNGRNPSDTAYHSLVYAVFPFVIWAALRFGQSGTTRVTFAASVFAIWGALHDLGPFGAGPTQDRLMSLQAFMAIVALTGLLLAAALLERLRDQQRKDVMHAVTKILAECSTLSEATPQLVQSICTSLGWHVGAIWELDRESQLLRCAGVWQVGSETFPKFEALTHERKFEKGIGLPGQVWVSGEPVWIPDVVHDPNFPRAGVAAQEGLHAAFGFPIRLNDELYGVIEFFSAQIRQPDEDLLKLMGTIGIQIGQFIERRLGDEDIRRSEARKSAMLESALDAVITMDHEGNIVEFNPAAEKMFGWARADALGKPLADLIVPSPLKERHRQGLTHYLATGEGAALDRRLELTALRSDGTEFPVELAVTRIPFHGPPMFTGYIRDITERKRMEDELRGRADELLAADRRKNEFLATLAHELRNPLAPIRNGLQVWRLSENDPQLMEQARDMMDRQLAQMVRLVDDLMDLSRVSRGTIELRRERIALEQIIEQAIETSRPIIDQAGHSFILDVPSSPIYVDADPIRMAQVLSNILNNSAKYTEPGGQIQLSAFRQDDDAVVKIKDDGVGIPPDMLSSIFDTFTQVNRKLERSQSGLGIGLSIVKTLVQMHDGSIEAISEGIGKGSEFIVRLPIVLSVVESRSDVADPREPSEGRRILVVDDNRDAATSLAMMLRVMGNDTRTAHDGLEAIDVGATYQPDIMFIDIGMPNLNGYETARRIRELPWGKTIVLAALTGWGQDDDRRKSEEAGFDFHLVKPAALSQVETVLASCAEPETFERKGGQGV